jgi:Cd2+/Zn2+-exporting ATPase
LSNQAGEAEKLTVYRVEGFTCANCAARFERNVKALPRVRDARVNFGASKLTVIGEATIEELEQAGAFENLKVRPERPAAGEDAASAKSVKAWLVKNAALVIAALLIAGGYAARFAVGEDHAATVLLYAASIVIGGFSLFRTGIGNLLRLEFDMRTLMTVAIIGAALIGEWAEGAVVVILFAISEALERFSMERARRSIRSLMDVAPREALIRRGEKLLTVRVEDVAVGDIMIVKPGQKLAMDGVVVGGRSSVDEAAITGESMPVAKAEGDEVFAGTLNVDGALEVRVTKSAEDTMIARIIHLVEEAQAERAPSQAFVDRFAKVYTPIIMAAAAAVAIVPSLITGEWGKWIYQGLSVLVVGCPCALVISTPISIVSAIGSAARNGVLIKGGVHLEQLGGVRAVAFDKTGTLTYGMPEVTDYRVFDPQLDPQALFAAVAALEARSPHPLAYAIVRKAERDGISYADAAVEDFVAAAGRGIRGTVSGRTYAIGSPQWLADRTGAGLDDGQRALIERWQSEGKTVVLIGDETGIRAALATADEVRASGREAVAELRRLGIRHTIVLTGDNRATAAAVAERVGADETRAERLPEDKLREIRRLRAEYGTVAMVGDGVNDAPALAAATVGVAMGAAGTDAALETADIALMGDDLRKLPYAIRLSRRTLRIIKQNIAFSLMIKLCALLLVVPGWLTLWIAVVADMGATLAVALNGMRLMRMRGERNR